MTSLSFSKTAMTLFSSLSCKPILPAKSSSLRLTQVGYGFNKVYQYHQYGLYSHRVANELVEDNCESWVVEGSSDVLNQ